MQATHSASAYLAAQARETSDTWRDVAATEGSANAVAEAQRRAGLYEQLAAVFEWVAVQEVEAHGYDGSRYTPIAWGERRK